MKARRRVKARRCVKVKWRVKASQQRDEVHVCVETVRRRVSGWLSTPTPTGIILRQRAHGLPAVVWEKENLKRVCKKIRLRIPWKAAVEGQCLRRCCTKTYMDGCLIFVTELLRTKCPMRKYFK